MKTKKFDKKLSLNKETIAHLKVEEMGKAAGGFGITDKCIMTIPDTCPCILTEWDTCFCSDVKCI